MGTRATIEIKDAFGESFFVYRGHDGYPESVLPDIQGAINLLAQRRFSSPDASHLTTVLLGRTYFERNSVPIYEITAGWHGDESYRYLCYWSAEAKGYLVTVKH